MKKWFAKDKKDWSHSSPGTSASSKLAPVSQILFEHGFFWKQTPTNTKIVKLLKEKRPNKKKKQKTYFCFFFHEARQQIIWEFAKIIIKFDLSITVNCMIYILRLLQQELDDVHIRAIWPKLRVRFQRAEYSGEKSINGFCWWTKKTKSGFTCQLSYQQYSSTMWPSATFPRAKGL